MSLYISTWSGQYEVYKIDGCCFSTENATLGRKSNEIRIMCQSGETCLPTDCCLSKHYKNPIKCVGVVQDGHHYHLIECSLFLP
jgi:hypothetical protein